MSLAFGRVTKIFPCHSHLDPECGRVTTALRCVVTRTLAQCQTVRQSCDCHTVCIEAFGTTVLERLQCNHSSLACLCNLIGVFGRELTPLHAADQSTQIAQW